MSQKSSIADMALYTNLDRIEKELAASGVRPTEDVQPEQLFSLDQWHYHGVEAVKAAAEALKLGPSSTVLDIGSGIGGPARYLASTTGAHVTALELQPRLHEIGISLTRRSNLADRVEHLLGDALQYPFAEGSYDAIVSWLAILHIPNRPLLLKNLARALRAGGACYIEDLCMRAPFAPADLRDLHEIVFGTTVTTSAAYVSDLRNAGLIDVVAVDLTQDWAPYAADRLDKWRANRESYVKTAGEAAFAAQETFYAVIAHLYQSGSLGGIRLIAHRA